MSNSPRPPTPNHDGQAARREWWELSLDELAALSDEEFAACMRDDEVERAVRVVGEYGSVLLELATEASEGEP